MLKYWLAASSRLRTLAVAVAALAADVAAADARLGLLEEFIDGWSWLGSAGRRRLILRRRGPRS
eukprot:7012057-Pyramimonas_sp.AAC.1